MQTTRTANHDRQGAIGVQAALGAALTIALAATAHAQPSDVIELDSWDLASVDGLWSADQLDQLEVRGSEGEAIGEVESVIIGADDKVAAIVLEVGGLLDVGDTHLRVNWSDVSVDPSGELAYLSVPVTDDNYDQFDLFGGRGEVDAARREWRASELVGDYVVLDDGDVVTDDYGYVEDLMFGVDGKLHAVIVNRNSSYGGEYYAYPFYGYEYDYGFDTGLSTYTLPYAQDDLTDRDAFGYEPFES